MKLRAVGEFSSALMAETVELLLLLQRRTSPVITVAGGVATTRYRLRTLASSSSDWRTSRSEMTAIPLHCLSQHLRVKTLASHNFRSPPPSPPLSQRRGIVNPKLILLKKAETMWGFRMRGQQAGAAAACDAAAGMLGAKSSMHINAR
jgi:hypothetical protein